MRKIIVLVITTLLLAISGCARVSNFADTFSKEIGRNMRWSQLAAHNKNRQSKGLPPIPGDVDLQNGYDAYIAPFVRHGEEKALNEFLGQYINQSSRSVFNELDQQRVVTALNMCGLAPVWLNEKTLAFCYRSVGLEPPSQRTQSDSYRNKKRSTQLGKTQEIDIAWLTPVQTRYLTVATNDDSVAWNLLAQVTVSDVSGAISSLIPMQAMWLTLGTPLLEAVPPAFSFLGGAYAGYEAMSQWLSTPQGQAWSMETADKILGTYAWLNAYAPNLNDAFGNIFTPSVAESLRANRSAYCNQNPCPPPTTQAASSPTQVISSSQPSYSVNQLSSGFTLWGNMGGRQECIENGGCSYSNGVVTTANGIVLNTSETADVGSPMPDPDENICLLEQLAMQEAVGNPSAKPITGIDSKTGNSLRDIKRLVSQYGPGRWEKMTYVARTSYGPIDVHFYRNFDTGKEVEFKVVESKCK
jgi:hypothetical protein